MYLLLYYYLCYGRRSCFITLHFWLAITSETLQGHSPVFQISNSSRTSCRRKATSENVAGLHALCDSSVSIMSVTQSMAGFKTPIAVNKLSTLQCSSWATMRNAYLMIWPLWSASLGHSKINWALLCHDALMPDFLYQAADDIGAQKTQATQIKHKCRTYSNNVAMLVWHRIINSEEDLQSKKKIESSN